jgi:hypothetical protein
MGSAPGWPHAGAAPCFHAAARKAGSSSPFRFRRSTGAPDGFGAPAASPSARTRVRHSPLPHPWPAPPFRASGYDLDGQPNGPAADGTDRPQVPVLRGGPQSFAAASARDLAARNPEPATGLGSGDQSTPGGLRRQLRYAPGPNPFLARNRAGYRVNRVSSAGTPKAPRFAHPRLSAGNFTGAAAKLPIYPLVLPVCTRGSYSLRRAQGYLARRSPSRPLSSLSSGRVRPCPLT